MQSSRRWNGIDRSSLAASSTQAMKHKQKKTRIASLCLRTSFSLVLLFLPFSLWSWTHPATSRAQTNRTRAGMLAQHGKLPIRFEAAREPNRYLTRGAGYSLQLGADEARLQLQGGAAEQKPTLRVKPDGSQIFEPIVRFDAATG